VKIAPNRRAVRAADVRSRAVWVRATPLFDCEEVIEPVEAKTLILSRPSDHSSRLARGELADPEAAERFEAEHPESYMRRRDFLARTAADKVRGGRGRR
jgi:hypothetical protein